MPHTRCSLSLDCKDGRAVHTLFAVGNTFNGLHVCCVEYIQEGCKGGCGSCFAAGKKAVSQFTCLKKASVTLQVVYRTISRSSNMYIITLERPLISTI